MIKDYALVIDSTSLVPDSIKELIRTEIVHLSISIDGVNKKDTDWDINTIVDAYWNNKSPHSSCPSPNDFLRAFNKLFSEGYKDIVCVPMSPGISGTYQAALLAISSLEEKYKNHVHLINVALANFGVKSIIISSEHMLKKEVSVQEYVNYLNDTNVDSTQLFTIKDLGFLYKGGRLNVMSFMVGKILRIKPVIEVNHETGSLKVAKKLRTNDEIDKFIIQHIQSLYEKYDHVYVNFIYLTDKGPVDELIKKTLLICPNIKYDISDEVGQVFTVHLGRTGYGACAFGYND